MNENAKNANPGYPGVSPGASDALQVSWLASLPSGADAARAISIIRQWRDASHDERVRLLAVRLRAEMERRTTMAGARMQSVDDRIMFYLLDNEL